MDNRLEKNLIRLGDKLVEASNSLGTKIATDLEAYKTYVAIVEAQSILAEIHEEKNRDLGELGRELESELLRKGWV